MTDCLTHAERGVSLLANEYGAIETAFLFFFFENLFFLIDCVSFFFFFTAVGVVVFAMLWVKCCTRHAFNLTFMKLIKVKGHMQFLFALLRISDHGN